MMRREQFRSETIMSLRFMGLFIIFPFKEHLCQTSERHEDNVSRFVAHNCQT